MESGILTTVLLPLSLAIIMFGMGLSLVLDDFRRILTYPKATILGLVNQLIVLPLLAFLMVKALNIEPILAVGFMLVAACPGGVTSNLMAHVSRGDTALSITLTAISSFITVITIPIIVSFSQNHFLSASQTITLPLVDTVIQILAITVVPVSIGMLVRNKFPNFALKMDKPTRIASAIILILLIIAITVTNQQMVVDNIFKLGGYSLFLLSVTMGFGFYSAKFFKLNLPQRISLAIETGIQNGALAIVIASSILQQPALAVPAAIYSLVMYGPGVAMMWYFGRREE